MECNRENCQTIDNAIHCSSAVQPHISVSYQLQPSRSSTFLHYHCGFTVIVFRASSFINVIEQTVRTILYAIYNTERCKSCNTPKSRTFTFSWPVCFQHGVEMHSLHYNLNYFIVIAVACLSYVRKQNQIERTYISMAEYEYTGKAML